MRISSFFMLGIGIALTWMSCQVAFSADASMYDQLKNQALNTKEYLAVTRKIDYYSCEVETNLDDDLHFEVKQREADEAGQSERFCYIDPTTACQQGRFAAQLDEDGTWLWIASRMRYIDYIQRISRRFGVPEGVYKKSLEKMDVVVHRAISKKLAQPVNIKNYQEPKLEMEVGSDFEKYADEINALEEKLAQSWEGFRNSQPEWRIAIIPTMIYDVSCGAGEIDTALSLSPPTGKLRIISDFDWLLCQVRGLDPWSFNKCMGWYQVLTDYLSLSGRYRYVATWQDGRSQQSIMDLSQVDQDSCVKLVIRADSAANLIEPESIPCP